MKQPITLHWQSKDAHYTAVLTQDLYGNWVFITAGGRRENRKGRVQHDPVSSYAIGLGRLNDLRKKRRKEGFILCATSFMELNDLDPHSVASRNAETNAVLRAFRNLCIPYEQQAILLNVEIADINSFLDGEILPDNLNLLARVRLIMAIHKALHLLFAGVLVQAKEWICTPNPRFDQARPLDLMLTSLDGLKIVRSYLEGEVDVFFEQPPTVTLQPEKDCSEGRS